MGVQLDTPIRNAECHGEGDRRTALPTSIVVPTTLERKALRRAPEGSVSSWVATGRCLTSVPLMGAYM